MRKTLLATLVTLLALPALSTRATAQGQGTIYFAYQDKYSVGGDGSGLRKLPIADSKAAHPSGRSDYVGGRRFQSSLTIGTIPNTSENYGDVTVVDLNGNSTRVTAFRGPEYVRTTNAGTPRFRWANDSLDDFISFEVWNPAAGAYSLYRAHVTGTDITTPGFVPLTAGDSRLELIIVSPRSLLYSWNGDGSKLVYRDYVVPVSGKTDIQMRVHFVAAGTDVSRDPLLIDQVASGFDLWDSEYSPTAEQVVTRVVGTDGTKGIISINPLNGQWSWLQKEYKSGQSGLYQLAYPVFSPDGTGVAFGGNVLRKGSWIPSVLKCPANGGAVSIVIQPPVNVNYVIVPLGWCW